MIPDRASLTALAVASLRGLADVPGTRNPVDPFAIDLLPPPWGALTRAARPLLALPGARRALNALGGGLPSHLVARTAAIDRRVLDAVRDGAHGVVLLGAGLDARAHRLHGEAPVVYWEIDHPDTQVAKRRAAPAHPGVTYVPVDFVHDDLTARLRDGGVPSDRPLVWVWEGVTPYLPHAATEQSLAAVAGHMAPGSTLLMTFALPEMVTLPAPLRPLGRLGFRLLGEPLLGLMSREDAARRAGEAGLSVAELSDPLQWWRDLGVRAPPLRVEEHLLTARKA